MKPQDYIDIIAKEEGKPEVISITYKGGRGHFQILTSALFNLPQKEFKIVCGMIDDAADREQIAETLQDYIALAAETLKKWRDRETEAGRTKEAAKYSKAMNKYLAFSGILADRYGVQTVAEPDKLKFKKTEVFVLYKKEIRSFFGWTFEKAGITFTAYKHEKTGKTHVLIPSVGRSAAIVDSRDEINAYLNELKIKQLKEIINCGSFADTEKIFAEAMEAAGFLEECKTRPELQPLKWRPQEHEPEAAADPVEEIQPEEKPETNYEPVIYSSAIIDTGYIENLHKEEKPAADPAPEEKQEEIQPEATADPVEEVQPEKIQAEEKPERIQKKEAPKAQRKKAEPPTFRGIPKKAKYTRVWCYAC